LETRLTSKSSELLISFLAYLGPKLWLKNKNWIKIQVPQKVTSVTLAKGHNLPADLARELFKSSKDSESLTL